MSSIHEPPDYCRRCGVELGAEVYMVIVRPYCSEQCALEDTTMPDQVLRFGKWKRVREEETGGQ